MSFELLKEEIEKGLKGENEGMPMGFYRLEQFIGIRKRIMTLIFGAPGSGKSAYLHSAYILNPFEYYLKHKDSIKFKVILFAMERSKVYTLAKWLSRRIFLQYGILIPIGRILKWRGFDSLTLDEMNLIDECKDYFEELLEVVDIIEGAQNPTGIYRYVKDYASENGKFEQIDEFHKIYIPNNPNEIVIIAEDHLGCSKTEKGQSTKKEAIDRVSEYNQWFRDSLGYSPVAVSQLNRNLSNPIFTKIDSFEPTIDDVKESGRPGEDSDVVISMFDPKRFNTNDKSYGNVDKFVDMSTGAKYFRSVKVVKNTYGSDDIRIGMAFQGQTGIFKELPKAKNMEGFDYTSLFDGTYFLSE